MIRLGHLSPSGPFRQYNIMRIIAGRLKGKKIKAPKGLATRPVLARVREALFNILGDIEGLNVLDLYAGTGSIGIEALSRGAASVVFVELGSMQCRIIRENLDAIGKVAVVMCSDVMLALKRLKNDNSVFDFVFADPPYEKGLSRQTILAVCESGILSDSGVMAVTDRYTEDMTQRAGNFEKVVDRRYGDTRLALYKGAP